MCEVPCINNLIDTLVTHTIGSILALGWFGRADVYQYRANIGLNTGYRFFKINNAIERIIGKILDTVVNFTNYVITKRIWKKILPP